MIAILLREMRGRLLLVALVGVAFYFAEPGFHRHDHDGAFGLDLGAFGIAATLANYASASIIILLAGFIAADRRHGYYRIRFSHPTRPLAFYGLRWALALAITLAAAALFLVLGQMAAWGEFEGGWRGLYLALLAGVAYGGLMAALSAWVLRGDAWIALAVFVLNYLWLQAYMMAAQPFPPGVNRLITFLLPPQLALSDVYDGLLRDEVLWAPSVFVLGYGVFLLVVAALLVRTREWP